jgi:hypothetical protein
MDLEFVRNIPLTIVTQMPSHIDLSISLHDKSLKLDDAKQATRGGPSLLIDGALFISMHDWLLLRERPLL